MNPLFGGTIELLRQAVLYSTRRHQVLAQNLANAETPGYRGQDVVFQDELDTAMRGRAVPVSAALPEPNGSALRTVPVYSRDGRSRVDGNDVDLDRQMVRLARNTIYYNAMVQILTQRFNGLKGAISGRV